MCVRAYRENVEIEDVTGAACGKVSQSDLSADQVCVCVGVCVFVCALLSFSKYTLTLIVCVCELVFSVRRSLAVDWF